MNLTWTLLNLLFLCVSVYGQDLDLNHENELEQYPLQTDNIAPRNQKIKRLNGKRARPQESDVTNTNEEETYDPMISRIAPQTLTKRGYSNEPYVITESRLKEIRQHFMYPYFDKGGEDDIGDYQRDIRSSKQSQLQKNLYFSLPFFGFRFNYTRVSLNGYLEFSDKPSNYEYPRVFPVKSWPKENDPSFIGIFYSLCKVGKLRRDDADRRSPGVYFRIERDLRTRVDQLGVELRERLKWDIREGVIGSETFEPKHAIIVTWKNVTFAGGLSRARYHTNTFQMVLATDEVYTYAMYNYLNIDWTSPTETGGDTVRGLGGVPAFVGFNAGNGTRSFEYKPYSQESLITDLTVSGYVNGFKGRHLFRIDENIVAGTCDNYIGGQNLPLVFSPESGNMLGGTIVNITGPCFGPNDVVYCKFGEADEVIGYVIDRNRAVCVQPQLSVEGYVNFGIIVGRGFPKWKGKYYVESPSTATQMIYFKDENYHEKSPSKIGIIWNRHNLTTNEDDTIDISLWGYTGNTSLPMLVHITNLATNIMNTGDYDIDPSQFQNRINETFTDIKFGFIKINLTGKFPYPSKEIAPILWSKPIPLGWYYQYQWENTYGQDWPKYLCDEWLTSDRSLNNFTQKLPECPCTLYQALTDKGKYMPDFDCDKDSNPTCYYNRAAVHCVRTGSPNLDGAEQQCCYDRNGYLMLSQDQQWGSSPRRSHSLGFFTYNGPSKIPTLSQWFNDVIPKYTCCLWQEEQAAGCETLRYERRPTQDCVSYEGPGIAAVYGDPHIVTFDDLEYTFNGKGEFVLVKSSSTTDNLVVQGRFEQMDNNTYGEVNATRLTSVVAKGMSETIIEVRKRSLDASWRYKLDVFANGKQIYFDKPFKKAQHFPGVTVYTPTYILNQSEVIIMFDNGVGVEVIDDQAYMSARVYLPRSLINKTIGLLGNWSFNPLDDFALPDGSNANISDINDMEIIYRDFGSQWMIDDSWDTYKGNALFWRDFGRTSSTFNDKTFKPQFLMRPEDIIPANRSSEVDQIYQVCSRNMRECYYDYAMTLNKDLARLAKSEKSTINTLKETARTKIVSCGILNTPRFGRKSTFLFIPGTIVTFQCQLGFELFGDSGRICQGNGIWNTPYYGYTKCLRSSDLL